MLLRAVALLAFGVTILPQGASGMTHPRYAPTQPDLLLLRERLGEKAFVERALEAERKVAILEMVEAAKRQGEAEAAALRRLAPGLARSTYRARLRNLHERGGGDWERLVDRRVPVKSWKVPPQWRTAVEVMVRMRPEGSFDEMRAVLVSQFGSQASLSDSKLRTILREAGVGRAVRKAGRPAVDAVELPGGGGLSLLLAAAAETQVTQKLAEVVKQGALALPASAAPPEPEGRDEEGRFTAQYNRNRLAEVEPGDPDPRFRSVEEARLDKDLSSLSVRGMRIESIENRLLTGIVTPTLSVRRGFVGLDAPWGAYAEVVSPVPYAGATLDKFYRELKYAGVGEAMWDEHLRQWAKQNKAWTEGQGFRQYVAYLDGSQDPWWTRSFACSGKVSRVGRVMPCLSRLLLCGGSGTPLLVDTFSGQASIKAQLAQVLSRVEEVAGEEELARLLVVDAELVSVKLFEELDRQLVGPDGHPRYFITVLKGSVLERLCFEPTAEAVKYRERDMLRDGYALLRHPDKGRKPYRARVVEMMRADSRHPTPTYFCTSAPADELAVTTVATAYLERWPHNEQIFRRARHGAGLEHSHGFGRRGVQHVALLTEREKVEGQLERARHKEQEAAQAMQRVQDELEREKSELDRLRAQRKQAEDVAAARQEVERQRRYIRAMQSERREAKRKQEQAARTRKRREAERERLASMPETIQKRDVELDSIATCLELTLVALLEYVLREYFGGLRMELETFIEEFIRLPVRIEKGPRTTRYLITRNNSKRAQHRMRHLETACAQITRRRIHHQGRRLILELAPPDEEGTSGA